MMPASARLLALMTLGLAGCTRPSTPSPSSMPRPVSSERDPALAATVVARTPLHYAAGADPAADRPAHVRAGSGLAWWRGRLALVQDDARFVALVEPASFRVDALALPRGPGGARVFGPDRGTKHLKLDLEAVAAVPTPEGEALVAFGSGSSDRREYVVVVREDEPPALVNAGALYASFREAVAFAGSELNVEGALVVPHAHGPRLRLFNRGNGAARDGFLPVNATVDLDLAALWDFLHDPDAPPLLLDVAPYHLGMLDGLGLGFTDAALASSGRLLVTLAAEDSPDATRDGRVAGSALGAVDEADGVPECLRWTPLRTPDGALFGEKVEGLAANPAAPCRVWLAVDPDDPARPAELCVAELSGPW